MTKLDELKELKDLNDLADFFDYEPKKLGYILYGINDADKYTKFEISKKSGGKRIIHSPNKSLLFVQKKLTKTLYECVEECKKERKKDNLPFWPASHGFQKKRTILSNANAHRRRRFVFNLDLEDFFGTINFGRVRGFFMKDRMFELHPDVATVIAKIVCHENKLPQGSPCSPIISNLIGNILDSRLLALARDTQCTYTRYADDLTFSKNKGEFPPEIAVEIGDGKWDVGKKLHKTIKDTGFTINASKTRMLLKNSRQTVTGLIVNKKVNIKQEYYRNTRSMCNLLFQKGFYHKPCDKEKINVLASLEGRISHIYFVKGRRDRNNKINKYLEEAGEFYPAFGTERLYKKFLFYKYFVVPNVPLIITEGSTDRPYLKSAIRMFASQFPSLASKKNGDPGLGVKILRPSNIIKDVLNLVNGTSGQAKLIETYQSNLKKYKHTSKIKHPVIILCDNDEGAGKVFKVASTYTKTKINRKTDDLFYKIFDSLYLVKIPEDKNSDNNEQDKEKVIEDKNSDDNKQDKGKVIEELFSEKLLNTKLNGKSFNYKNKINENTEYSKNDFAQKVVLKAKDPDDFKEFIPLLERIQAVIDDHKAKK